MTRAPGFYDEVYPNVGPSGTLIPKPVRASDLTLAISRELEKSENS